MDLNGVATTLADVSAAVLERVSYLRCHITAPASDGWLGCAELIADHDLLGRQIAATGPGRGTTNEQVAASLFAQGYAFRVPSIAVAAYALDLPVPSVAPSSMAMRITRHRPGEVAILDPNCTALDVDAFVDALFVHHLVPFVAAVRATTRVGERLLWGNVAASLATIFRAVQSHGPLGDVVVRDRAVEFHRVAAPWLRGLGDYSTIEAPGVLGWYWTRTNCCLWYQTDGGWRCDDCSLHDRAELAGQRRAALVESQRSQRRPEVDDDRT
jgi:ferric iron reductase protein FhuF